MKFLLIFTGLIFLTLGFIGIFIPGLPTTPFLLLSAGLFVKSSDRLYNWVISNRYCGKYIQSYREHKAIPFSAKLVSWISMWIMIIISIIFFIESLEIQLLLAGLGAIGSIVLLCIPTLKK